MQEQKLNIQALNRKHSSNLHKIGRSNKAMQANCLTKVMNFNPWSIYNKLYEFVTFLEEQDIDLVCMSESHERAYGEMCKYLYNRSAQLSIKACPNT